MLRSLRVRDLQHSSGARVCSIALSFFVLSTCGQWLASRNLIPSSFGSGPGSGVP